MQESEKSQLQNALELQGGRVGFDAVVPDPIKPMRMLGISVSPSGVQSPTKSQIVKPDWQKFQGPASEHFALAKANGYDFYAVTDHSQERAFALTSPANAAWPAPVWTGRY